MFLHVSEFSLVRLDVFMAGLAGLGRRHFNVLRSDLIWWCPLSCSSIFLLLSVFVSF